MVKLIFHRVQTVQVELLREPNKEEMDILLGKDEDFTMFSLREDLINFDKEEVINEDYSDDVDVHIPKNKLIFE